jgi:hypothetical protein
VYVSRGACLGGALDGVESEDYALRCLTAGIFGACPADLSPASLPGAATFAPATEDAEEDVLAGPTNHDDWPEAILNDQKVYFEKFYKYPPQRRGDVPSVQCSLCGLWSAPSMIRWVDGLAYDVECAPQPSRKRP